MTLADRARKRLAQWMDASPHITQKEVGLQVGHTQGWVSELKRGIRNADIDEWDAIARVYGHTIFELLDARPDPRESELLDAYRETRPELRSVALDAVRAIAGRLPTPPPRKRNGG